MSAFFPGRLWCKRIFWGLCNWTDSSAYSICNTEFCNVILNDIYPDYVNPNIFTQVRDEHADGQKNWGHNHFSAVLEIAKKHLKISVLTPNKHTQKNSQYKEAKAAKI